MPDAGYWNHALFEAALDYLRADNARQVSARLPLAKEREELLREYADDLAERFRATWVKMQADEELPAAEKLRLWLGQTWMTDAGRRA